MRNGAHSGSKLIEFDPNQFRTYNVHMNALQFEWDTAKNRANIKKHNISFTEAKSAFYDEQALVFSDPDHSVDEERFILLGLSIKTQVLVVCHCFRQSETVVRIISARKADSDEVGDYWRNRS